MNYTRAELDAIDGTHLQTYIDATYKELVALLGQPYEGDNYKVSGQWVMQDPEGNIVTVYDWKSTRLYDPDYPTVRQFRAMKWEQRFNIGGHNAIAAENFRHWLALSLINLRQKNRKVG
jgi:hypothetical protein